jgi:AraC-like DNA-binding protein
MYRFFVPHSALQPYIESYWMLRAAAFTLHEHIFVDARADLIFNYGAAYQRNHLDSLDTRDTLAVSNLDAQRQYPLAIAQQGNIHLIAARFRPGGLAAFLSIPLYELSNLAIDIGSAFGKSGIVLESQLYDAAHDPMRQVELLNDFFLRRLHVHHNYASACYIAQRLEATCGEISVQALSAEVGYSIRTVDRLFARFFGVSPKFYARVVRFQRVMALLSKETTFAEIALICGYYDQSHLSKEFNAFTGESAERYRARLLEKLAAPAPNVVQFLQDT